ncbi:MAG: hypothetical protein WAW69_07070 [Polaromonas sp.]
MKTWLKISSMRFVAQRISLSQILLKDLLTVLAIPCDGDPENFTACSNSAMYEFLTSFGLFFQELDIPSIEAIRILCSVRIATRSRSGGDRVVRSLLACANVRHGASSVVAGWSCTTAAECSRPSVEADTKVRKSGAGDDSSEHGQQEPNEGKLTKIRVN